MKKILSIILILSIKTLALTPIKIESPLIHNLDGHLIDGGAIMMQKQVLVSISTIVYGKHGVGTVDYAGKKISLQKLSIEERKIDSEMQKKYSLSVKNAYHEDPAKWPNEFRDKIVALRAAFDDAKNQFKDATFPFLDKIKHFKDPVLKIMSEWSEKRKRTNSDILRWADTDGNEEALFHSTITTNNDLNSFLYDIMVFLNDFSHNCPKANDQFVQYMKEKDGK